MIFFSRKLKNRRMGREFVLDVKLRSSQVRANRFRMAAVALGIIFAVVLGVFLVCRGGQWALNQLLYENNSFAIQNVEIQTDGPIATDQIRKWAGVRPGLNLLALDLARVKRDIEMASVVESASVERILPHTLRIRVIEREPVAQLKVPRPKPGGGIELIVLNIDSEGWVLAPLDAQQRAAQAPAPEELPEIFGLPDNEVQSGRRILLPSLQAALQLLLVFESSPMEGISYIKKIDVSSSDVLTITTGQGSEVTFGLANFEQQLRRWHLIQDAGLRFGKAVASLDLAVTNNIPVRWLEASAVPPASPKTAKPLRPRKKHV